MIDYHKSWRACPGFFSCSDHACTCTCETPPVHMHARSHMCARANQVSRVHVHDRSHVCTCMPGLTHMHVHARPHMCARACQVSRVYVHAWPFLQASRFQVNFDYFRACWHDRVHEYSCIRCWVPTLESKLNTSISGTSYVCMWVGNY